jgi:hypothetical protein
MGRWPKYIKRKARKIGKVHEWKCPTCGLLIKSLYPGQLSFNKASHLITHEGKEGEK